MKRFLALGIVVLVVAFGVLGGNCGVGGSFAGTCGKEVGSGTGVGKGLLETADGGADIGIRDEKSRFEYIPSKPAYNNTFFDANWFSPSAKDNEVKSGNEGEVSSEANLGVTGSRSDNGTKRPPDKIRGAVVPHHLLAHALIEEVFDHLRADPAPLVVLIGPNHFNKGGKILTSSWGWQTPFGTVDADKDGVDWLLGLTSVKEDPEVFKEEHSMGNLMPFIKYYLPEARVVPIILHHDVSPQEARQLANRLSHLEDSGAVILASVDFSHYLTREQAEEKDAETLKVLESGNTGRLFTMDNDYIDSPASLGTLLYAMEGLGIDGFTLLGNTNSGVILKNDLIETTSYMTLLLK